MYKIWYTIISYSYGNVSGRCGEYYDIDSAIDHVYELEKAKEKGESFGISVNWEVNDNV